MTFDPRSFFTCVSFITDSYRESKTVHLSEFLNNDPAASFVIERNKNVASFSFTTLFTLDTYLVSRPFEQRPGIRNNFF